MAEVFLAVARGPVGFNKLAVVKRLRNPEEESHLTMFLDEARLAARLNHPNVVHTYEVGQEAGKYFIAMEYLEGQSLQDLMKSMTSAGRGLDDAIIALVASNALKGLHHAHELCDFDGTPFGVVHRDVSPHNVFITYTGEIKVLDFGIAKASLNSTHTETGVLKGKVRYMAPEQVSDRNVDRRADVFAFGVVLWEMLARRPLFQGDAVVVLTKLVSEDVPTVRSVRPEASPELEAIAMKALRRDPDERYATADEMHLDIERFLNQCNTGVEKTLAGLMSELFGKKHDEVKARIKNYMAKLPPGEDSMTGRLVRTGELPVISEDVSVTGQRPVAVPTASESAAVSPVEKKRSLLAPVVAALAVVVAGVLAVRKPAPAPLPAAAVAAAPVPVAVPLPAPAVTAQVRVESVPPGALIERNGRPLDRTPASITLDPGKQTLVLTLDGYEPETLSIDAHEGDMGTESVTLHKVVAPKAIAPASPPVFAPAKRAPSAAPRPAPVAAPQAAPAKPAPEKVKIRVLDDSQ